MVVYNYFAARAIRRARPDWKSVWVVLSIVVDLGVLAYFKYAYFLADFLNDLFGLKLPQDDLAALAARLGSDCAFFIYNRPMLARGRGEMLTPFDLSLEGRRLEIFPQDVFVSTREAYAALTPHQPDRNLDTVLKEPVESWRDHLVNDFEVTVFARYPQLAAAKEALYAGGAVYAAMSGSGSALFAIY